MPGPDLDAIDTTLRTVSHNEGETAADRAARIGIIRRVVLALRPADAAETALASAAALHIDAAQAALGGLGSMVDPAVRDRAIAKVVSLDRAAMGYLRELRLLRTEAARASATPRPAAGAASEPAYPASAAARANAAILAALSGLGLGEDVATKDRDPPEPPPGALAPSPGAATASLAATIPTSDAEAHLADGAAHPPGMTTDSGTRPAPAPPLNRAARRAAERAARRANKYHAPKSLHGFPEPSLEHGISAARLVQEFPPARAAA